MTPALHLPPRRALRSLLALVVLPMALSGLLAACGDQGVAQGPSHRNGAQERSGGDLPPGWRDLGRGSGTVW